MESTRTKKAYIFDGGSSVQFLEPPKVEDNVSISSITELEVDSVETDVAETIKVGDTYQLEKHWY